MENSKAVTGQGRREFLKNVTLGAAVTGAAAMGTSCAIYPMEGGLFGKKAHLPAKRGSVILFQGDSITDAGRDRNAEGSANHIGAMGRGYAYLIATQLLGAYPHSDLKIYNRGISGHKVPQLAERWDKDCIDLQPDLLSILIGVNDIWHKRNGQYAGDAREYEAGYMALVDRTRQALPSTRLVICEPFVLKCGAVDDSWFPDFDLYRAAARRVAKAHKALFVPFHSVFEKAVADGVPPSYWAGDGVHPSMAGAELMAKTWLKTVGL